MSYKISYGSTKENKGFSFRLRKPILAAVAVLIAIGIRIVYPNETKQITQALFPLTGASSQAALEVFSESIRAGESLGDAVTAFCQEIINEADNS